MPDNRKPLAILYVEDELITQMTLHRILAKRYATIHVAANGKDGLELFEKRRPDIIVTDSRMPVMDGLTMAREIRARNSTVPVIFITASEDDTFLEEMKQLDVTRIIVKPIIVSQLLSTLEEIADNLLSAPAQRA